MWIYNKLSEDPIKRTINIINLTEERISNIDSKIQWWQKIEIKFSKSEEILQE